MKIEDIHGLVKSNVQNCKADLIPTSEQNITTRDSLYFHFRKTNGEETEPKFEQKPYAIVCEEDSILNNGINPTVIVEDARAAFACAMSEECEIDYDRLKIIGITGTNGKTTTATLIERIFLDSDMKVGFIGTGQIRINGEMVSDKFYSMTTPDPSTLYPTLARMQNEGCEVVVMEVSSHSIKLKKTEPIKFKYCLFTNFSKEHLDFHLTEEEYLKTKQALFKQCECGVFNIDDACVRKTSDEAKCKAITVGVLNKADIYALNIELNKLNGSRYYLRAKNYICGVETKLPGPFNVYNTLMALATVIDFGIKPCVAKRSLSKVTEVKGRLELIRRDIDVVIDYAHTAEAFENTLKYLYSCVISRQSLILVFGCGGNRDKSKRKEFAKAAEKYSEMIILTEDNSRNEPTEEIIKEVLSGASSLQKWQTIPCRRAAIFKAIKSAAPGSVVAILGKGDEPYAINENGFYEYSDRQTVYDALAERGKAIED